MRGRGGQRKRKAWLSNKGKPGFSFPPSAEKDYV
jgi:hypothetical protein